MLVPLYTLPGWPTAQDPSPLQQLGLLIGLPLVVIVIVAIIAKVSKLIRASRGESVQVTEPMWVGGLDRPEIEGPRHDEAAEAAKEIAAADQPSKDVGGAGARW